MILRKTLATWDGMVICTISRMWVMGANAKKERVTMDEDRLLPEGLMDVWSAAYVCVCACGCSWAKA